MHRLENMMSSATVPLTTFGRHRSDRNDKPSLIKSVLWTVGSWLFTPRGGCQADITLITQRHSILGWTALDAPRAAGGPPAVPAGQAWGPVISAWQYLGGEVPPHEAAAESGEQPNGEAGDGLPDVQAALATVVAQLRTMAAPGRAEAYRHACSMYVLHPESGVLVLSGHAFVVCWTPEAVLYLGPFSVPRPAQQHNFRALDAGAPVLALGWKAPNLELQGVPVFPDPAPWPFQPCLANFWQAGLPKINLTISEERTRSWLKEVQKTWMDFLESSEAMCTVKPLQILGAHVLPEEALGDRAPGPHTVAADHGPTVEAPATEADARVVDVSKDTVAIRCIDWERDRFDIEFGLEKGTTYKSYIIYRDKTALVDASHEKFRGLHMSTLKKELQSKGRTLDNVMVSSTEPDHSGLIPDILDSFPEAQEVGSKVALMYSKGLTHRPFEQKPVKGGDKVELSSGHTLEVVMAPNLYRPDTIFPFDHATGVMYTCDAFAAHYATEAPFDTELQDLDYTTVATGHGPVIRYNQDELIGRYRKWSESVEKATAKVAVLYASDYGFSDRLSQTIARGITKANVAVVILDLLSADPQELIEVVGRSSGVVLMAPPTESAEAAASMSTLLSRLKPKQKIVVVESCRGKDEPVDTLTSSLVDINVSPTFDPLRGKETPNQAIYQAYEETGTDLAQNATWVPRPQTVAADHGPIIEAPATEADAQSVQPAQFITRARRARRGPKTAFAVRRSLLFALWRRHMVHARRAYRALTEAQAAQQRRLITAARERRRVIAARKRRHARAAIKRAHIMAARKRRPALRQLTAQRSSGSIACKEHDTLQQSETCLKEWQAKKYDEQGADGMALKPHSGQPIVDDSAYVSKNMSEASSAELAGCQDTPQHSSDYSLLSQASAASPQQDSDDEDGHSAPPAPPPSALHNSEASITGATWVSTISLSSESDVSSSSYGGISMYQSQRATIKACTLDSSKSNGKEAPVRTPLRERLRLAQHQAVQLSQASQGCTAAPTPDKDIYGAEQSSQSLSFSSDTPYSALRSNGNDSPRRVAGLAEPEATGFQPAMAEYVPQQLYRALLGAPEQPYELYGALQQNHVPDQPYAAFEAQQHGYQLFEDQPIQAMPAYDLWGGPQEAPMAADPLFGTLQAVAVQAQGMFAGGLFAAQHPVGQEVLHAAGLEAQQPIPQQPQPAPYRALPGLCHPFYYVDVTTLVALGELGEGGFAKVFSATCPAKPEMGAEMAVKLIKDPTQLNYDQFCEEASIQAALGDHPNVLPLKGLVVTAPTAGWGYHGSCENWPVRGLITPMMPGGMLWSQLQDLLPRSDELAYTESRIPLLPRARVALKVAEGLMHMHQRRVVHLDLKSSNILLGGPLCVNDNRGDLPEVVIADFGLAVELTEGSFAYVSQRGTTRFMAPEMVRGRVHELKAVSTASDVWAFGMLLFELATLQDPYFHIPPPYIETAVAAGLFPEYPAGLEVEYLWMRLMQACLMLQPEDRITIEDVIDGLQSIIENC